MAAVTVARAVAGAGTAAGVVAGAGLAAVPRWWRARLSSRRGHGGRAGAVAAAVATGAAAPYAPIAADNTFRPSSAATPSGSAHTTSSTRRPGAAATVVRAWVRPRSASSRHRSTRHG